MSIQYHIIKVVGPQSVQVAVTDALMNNEDPSWSEQRLGLDYFRVSEEGLKEFVKKQENENGQIAASGFRSVQFDEEEIRVRGRVRAVARAVNEARGQVANGTAESPVTSPRRGRGRPAAARPTANDDNSEGEASDGEPATKKPASSGRGRGRPPSKAKKADFVKKMSTGKRGRPSKAAVAARASSGEAAVAEEVVQSEERQEDEDSE